MIFSLNTDGASRGNPGKASYGYIIYSAEGVILHQEGKYIGVTTNNVAEYTGVLEALKYIQKRWAEEGNHEVIVRSDSLLIVQQMVGLYKIKKPHLLVIYLQIKELEEKLGVVTYSHVPRAQNFIADRLANQALDNLI